ncbi:MAG: hypothetical protein ACO3E0_02575, partial [Candidatus Kapaibacteriota bacterium]
MYHVLLYYHFVAIDDPELLASEQREQCETLGLRGRILVAPTGINGTVSGPRESCDHYR